MAPEAHAATILPWLALGQCMPILATAVLQAIWGTSPGKRALHLRIVDADTGHQATDDSGASGSAHTRLSAQLCDMPCGILVGAIQPAKAAAS